MSINILENHLQVNYTELVNDTQFDKWFNSTPARTTLKSSPEFEIIVKILLEMNLISLVEIFNFNNDKGSLFITACNWLDFFNRHLS